jgi:hypothetical protein
MCMSCRKLLCQECTSLWEGINYCGECAGALARPAQQRASRGGMIVMLVFTITIAIALIRVAVGMGALLAGLF